MHKPNLFSPISMGDLSLSNRMVMASMTRNRAPENIPPAVDMTQIHAHFSGIYIANGGDARGYTDYPFLDT